LISQAGAAKGGELGALLQIQAPPGELDEVNPDLGYLEKLASASGGAIIQEESLASVLEQREVAYRKLADQGGNVVWQPLWDKWWLLVVILGALTLEWIIRRRNGLA
jgi:hypothetical protein